MIEKRRIKYHDSQASLPYSLEHFGRAKSARYMIMHLNVPMSFGTGRGQPLSTAA